MKSKTLAREVQALVSISAKFIRNSVDERLAAYQTKISALQYSILQVIRQDKLTISEVSKVQMVDPSTLVPAVDALERAGYAKRTKDPKDRRRTPLEITDKGRALLEQIPLLDDDDVLVRGLAEMSADQQEELLNLLRLLVSKLMSEEAVTGLTELVRQEMLDYPDD